MENQEFTFTGKTINGFLMLILSIIIVVACVAGFIYGINMTDVIEGRVLATIATTIGIVTGKQIGRAHV